MTTILQIIAGNPFNLFENTTWCYTALWKISMYSFKLVLVSFCRKHNVRGNPKHFRTHFCSYEFVSCSDLLNNILEYCSHHEIPVLITIFLMEMFFICDWSVLCYFSDLECRPPLTTPGKTILEWGRSPCGVSVFSSLLIYISATVKPVSSL